MPSDERKKAIVKLKDTGKLTYAQIGEIFGVSRQRIFAIAKSNKTEKDKKTDKFCLLCGSRDSLRTKYIDGDKTNTKPSNQIILCKTCRKLLKQK